MRSISAAMFVLSFAFAAQPVMATTVSDPVGDFIPSYTGPHLADLDVISFSADLVGANFVLSATMAGPIGSGDGFYVIGVDRGGSPAPFTSIGETGVLFNSVVVLQQNSTGLVSLIPGVTNLSGGAVTISGSTISAIVPLALLPTTGFAPLQYGFNIWPRSTAVATGIAAISDFAPNNATITAVPEPVTWALLLFGFGGAVVAMRRRRALGFEAA